MEIEVWSDVVCPFCYLGKRHLAAALAEFEHRDEVTVTWRSFLLDPTTEPGEPGSSVERLTKKYGMPLVDAQANQERLRASGAEVGIDFRWDLERPDNTIDAHRFAHLVRATVPDQADAVTERLFRAHFTEGLLLSDHNVLADLGAEFGVDRTVVLETLAGDAYRDAVEEDLAQARAYGISGVPFFVLNGAYGVSGAQPVAVLSSALQQAWDAGHALVTVTGAGTDADGASCEGDACAI